jgi:hypothetical protein
VRGVLSLHGLELEMKVELLGDFLIVDARSGERAPAIPQHVE